MLYEAGINVVAIGRKANSTQKYSSKEYNNRKIKLNPRENTLAHLLRQKL